MTTYDVESLFTNIPLNDAIIFVYDIDETNIPLNDYYLFMTTYDDESLFTNIPLNDAINICL